ncbi:MULTISPECIES: hypothetical protein [unclassified Blautia]|uniref:hypothetical protein n=1 Tax=unclassified Blautia TaxID=2648079 RepID=UPI001FD5B276|nr:MULTISPECIES: hypothetical protein [unclassified Blautia]MCJ7861192.1 hypothetical protein [Blautia sp. NSJ-157]MCJ7864004.1 hypothetical protein [Blautia sp. NSJ-140]
MSKSVLVIDTPTNCYDCPLKPLPEEKEEEYWRSKLSLAWIRGWNTCISKIIGGEVDD